MTPETRKGRKLQVGDKVYDEWWPERRGRVVRVTKTTVKVDWYEVRDSWTYDREHQRFLERGK